MDLNSRQQAALSDVSSCADFGHWLRAVLEDRNV
jgi:hypothetical protein